MYHCQREKLTAFYEYLPMITHICNKPSLYVSEFMPLLICSSELFKKMSASCFWKEGIIKTKRKELEGESAEEPSLKTLFILLTYFSFSSY